MHFQLMESRQYPVCVVLLPPPPPPTPPPLPPPPPPTPDVQLLDTYYASLGALDFVGCALHVSLSVSFCFVIDV